MGDDIIPQQMSQPAFGAFIDGVLAAFDCLPEAVLVLDAGGAVRAMNRVAVELVGGAAAPLSLAGAAPEVLAVCRKVAAGSGWRGRLRLSPPGFPDLDADWTVEPLRAPGEVLCVWRAGNVAPAEGATLPIDALPQVVAIHRLVRDASGQAIDYVFEDCNQQLLKRAGRSREQLAGSPIGRLWPGGGAPFLDRYVRVVETQVADEFEATAPVTGAQLRIGVAPLGGDRFASIVSDVTQQREAEAALQREQAFTAAVMDSVPGMVYVYDSDGYLVRWNKEHERLTGFSAAELNRKHVLDWYDDKWKAVIAERVGVVMKEGRASAEPMLVTKSGEVIPVLVTAVRMELDGKIYFAGIGLDLTERRKAEAERDRLGAQLIQAQRLESVGKLAGGIAHDFNNLLTVINGYSTFLLEALPAGEVLRGYADAIHQAGERAASLTRQLLAFSRRQVIEPKPLCLNSVVRDIEGMLERLIGEDIEVVTKLDAELGTALADPGQMHQVLMNLIVNARDAMPDGGKLLIETANVELTGNYALEHPEVVPGPVVMLAVTDSGVGMDQSTLQMVFEPFFTTKGVGKGTGLGLSTVYGIVRQSGGWIWVYSEPGHGSTFKVYLPRIEAREAVAAPAEKLESAAASETILVVEDQESVRNLTVTILNSLGYRTMAVARAEEALRLAHEYSGRIDLLLTDVVLPGMNGRQLADQLAQSRPEMKVIFASGYTENVIAHRGVLDAGVAYIPKPFSAGTLRAKVRAVLGG